MPSNKKTGSGKSKSKYQMKYKATTAYAAGSKARSGAYPSQAQKDRAASQGQAAQNRLLRNAISVGNNQGNIIDGGGMRVSGSTDRAFVNPTGRQKKSTSVDNRGRMSGGKKKSPTAGTTKAKTARAQRAGGTSQKMTSKKVTSVRNPTKPKATLQGRGSANAQIRAKAAATPRSKKSKLKRGR
jgi:hypothetical protein